MSAPSTFFSLMPPECTFNAPEWSILARQSFVERRERKDFPLESDAEPHFAADLSQVAHRRAPKCRDLVFEKPHDRAI